MLYLILVWTFWITIGATFIPYPANVILGFICLFAILILIGFFAIKWYKLKIELNAIGRDLESQNKERTLPSTSSMRNNTNMETPLLPGTNFGSFRHNFTFEELEKATNRFSSDNFLGRGGFGVVHKGILDNGIEIAVKQLISDCRSNEREFIAEIDALSVVHHFYLVNLIGYCVTTDRRFLVFEYVPNKTVEFHLHGCEERTIDWKTRLKISIGSAKGIAYLHDECRPQIVHRDIKAANILLDNTFEAKVADFGLAKLLLDGNTHVYTSNIIGTRGYTPLEYHQTGEVRKEFDTYSFGVVLLELITGKKPIMANNTLLADWAKPLLKGALEDGNYSALVDSRLHDDYNFEEMNRMIVCALACLEQLPENRPLMSQVVLVLEGHALSHTIPGFSGRTSDNTA